MLCAITGTQVLNRKGFWQTEGIPRLPSLAAWSERYEITLARMDLGEVWRMRLERLKFFRAETIRRFWIIWLWWVQEFWQVHSRCAISRNRTVQAEAAVALTIIGSLGTQA